ncbi:MAG: tetratricopeptide repeat protein [Candidatus Competibacteraceae bacterium]
MRFTGDQRGNNPGVPPPDKLFMVVTGLLIALVWLTLWSITHPRSHQSDCALDEECQSVQEAIARWEQLWQQIATDENNAETASSVPDKSLRAAGDTVFMRYRHLWVDVDRQTRHAFRLSALSNQLPQKIELLQPLLQAHDAQIRFRAWLEIARLQLRARDLKEAETAAREALGVADIDPKLTVDAHFILAYTALEQRQFDVAEQALEQAVSLDSGFWDARQVQMWLLTRQLDNPRQTLSDCLDRTRLLIENLRIMPALGQNRVQFRDFADLFRTGAASGNAATHLLAGLGDLWAGDRDKARDQFLKVKQSRGRLPVRCAALIAAKADELLNSVGSRETP